MKSLDDYPASSWRPHQRDYAGIVLKAGTGPSTRIGVEGPCGSGKSIGYLRAALAPGFPACNVLSTTRAHLRQLEATLEEHFSGESWAVLRGRSFYPCCGKAPEGAEKDEEWTSKRKCRKGVDCLYVKAIQECAEARVVLQCTLGFLYRQQYWQLEEEGDEPTIRSRVVDREVCILDEAHEFLGVRRTFETSELKMRSRDMPVPDQLRGVLESARRTKGGYIRGYLLLSDGPDRRHVPALLAYLKGLEAPAEMEKRRPNTANTPAKWETVKKKYVEQVGARRALLESDHEYTVLSLLFDPDGSLTLKMEPLFAHVETRLAPVEIFTSATLEDCAPLLKIEHLHQIPEVFDWDRNVSTYLLPDEHGGMSNRAIDAGMMCTLYEQDERPMTIALFMSKRHVRSAAAEMRGKENVWVQGEDGDISELVTRVNSGDYDTFGVAPFLLLYSGWVGTDIPGDKWVVLGSATRSPLGAVHEARKMRRKGGGWTDKEKVVADRTQLQQGLGRALRSGTDKAVIIWTNNSVFASMGLDPETARLR